MKILITPEISISSGRSLLEWEIFHKAKLVVMAEWIGHEQSNIDLLQKVQQQLPQLVITTEKSLCEKIEKSSISIKAILLQRADIEYISAREIAHIKAFLKSPCLYFIL